MFRIPCICFLLIFGFNLCLCYEETWLAYQNDLRNANREELVITNVTTDENFKVNANVEKWTSLSIGSTCYSVGIMDNGLAILISNINANNSMFDIKTTIKELGRKPLDVILLQHRKMEVMEAILIVAFHDDLNLEWYKIQETELEPFWSWTLTQPVVHINAFSVNAKHVLLLAYGEYGFNENSAHVDLYQYDLKNGHKNWFWHSIDVSSPTTSSAFNNFEFDSYLSLPQKTLNLVAIFKHEDNRFVHYHTIQSKDVERVVSFEIGFQSFLAIDGLDVGIYRFKRDGLEMEDIVNSNLDGIEYWLPIPVNTYRDEVVVLAQRNVDHTSHNSYVVEIITYNGAKFEEHEDILCTHFGEKVEWLTCLTEDNGIIGSGYISIDEKLGLIVPTPSNISLLFNISFEIKQVSNPMELELKELLDKKEKLQEMIDIQIRDYEEFKKISESSDTVDERSHAVLLSRQSKIENTPLGQQLEDIAKDIEDIKEKVGRIAERENRTEFDVITINGIVEIEGEGKFNKIVVEKLGGKPATELLEDVVSKDAIGRIPGDKIINKLDVDHIIFDKINGAEATDLVFRNDSVINLTGDITIHDNTEIENVHVLTGLINDVDLVNEIVDMRNGYDGTLNFETVKVEKDFKTEMINGEPVQLDQMDSSNNNSSDENQEMDTIILQNVTITNINGDDFDIFIKQLCLIDIKCYIPSDLKINGNITAEKASTTFLNNLKFPEEYIFKGSDHKSITITGGKTFRNSLVANKIRSLGNIDGVDTKNLITLSSNQQEIAGTITFKDIEVVQELNVSGEVLGEDIEMFLPNPTLQVVKKTSSNVNFTKLEVDGDIIIENDWNRDNFETLVNNIIYKDEEEVEILAQKDFPQGFTVKENLEVYSNSINNTNLDSIVTKDTDQVLNITLLKGNVIIDNIVVEGMFNGENVTQIEQDLVQLTKNQPISSTLTFVEEVEVEKLEALETLNGITLEEYLARDGDEEINSEYKFEDIKVENVKVEGNFSGSIPQIDIANFDERYLSYSKDQVIDVHFDIVHSTVENLKAESLNGEDYEDLFGDQKFLEKIIEMLNTGHIKIKDLYVNGPLQIDTINGKNDSDWLPKDILKDSDGKHKKDLVIEGNVYFDVLRIDKLSNVKWDWFNQQLVLKDEKTTVIDADSKNFLGGIKVAKLIETKKVNGIPIENIFTKQGQQIISGPITIKGNVLFKESVTIAEKLNEIAVGEILDNLLIDDGTYYIKGDKFFNRLQHIKNLDIEGYVNNKNFTEYLTHIVNCTEDYVFQEEFVFEGPVHIAGNLAIEQGINGIDMSDLDSQIVLTTKDAQIQSRVTFMQPVIIKKGLVVDGDLITSTLYGADLEQWKNNSVYVDRGMVKGTYEFDEIIIKDALMIKYLNEIDATSIIPLKSSQIIDYLEFGEVTATKDIPVTESVNGYSNLMEEFQITVMNDTDQSINSDVIFNNVILVRENLFATFINGKEASKMVTTDTDQNLTTTFNFKALCKINSDLHVSGLIDGINLTLWKNRNMKKYSPKVQIVYDDWYVTDNLTFHGDVGGGSLISDLNLTKIMKEVEEKNNYRYSLEHGIIKDYKNMCEDVLYLYEALKKQIYKFKYFEGLHTMTFSNNIEYVHYFQFEEDHYLLVNDNNCTTHLLVFRSKVFEHLDTLEMGHLSQVVTVQGKRTIYLVTRDSKLETKCNVEGTNIWNFDGETLELYYNMEEQDLLQQSDKPFTFYGLNKQEVVEYNVRFNDARKYRSWKVSEENIAFMPRGLKTGLSLRTGNKIIYLDNSKPVVEGYSSDIHSMLIGNTSEVVNSFVPGRNGDDLVVTTVGIKSAKRNLLAIATHEETSVKGRLDFVKIYSDALKGEIFHKVPAYKPSSLLSVEFGQGETLLVFMENEKKLQVYEYKGIEGFKHRTSAKVEGSKLFLMTLPMEPYLNPRKTIGIVHKNKIKLITAVMAGNQIREGLKCAVFYR